MQKKGLNSVTTGNTVMNSDGLTINGGPKIVKDGIDAGVSLKLGQGNHVSTSRVAMAKELKD
ncbi:MAG: hypothetical protein E6Z38_09735, partial [Veillonella sp.]|nr:hypothetical protein [Veillonella sp.]